jgi:hypothetical protein
LSLKPSIYHIFPILKDKSNCLLRVEASVTRRLPYRPLRGEFPQSERFWGDRNLVYEIRQIKFKAVGVIDNNFKHCYIRRMKAQLLIKTRRILSENAFVEAVIWKVPQPVIGSTHNFKYRLAFVIDGICQLRYDNEAGKGDHKYAGAVETVYYFTSPEQLLSDFWHDVDNWEA